MAYELFINRKFTLKSQRLIGQAVAVCDRYRELGFDLSLRQLFYQLVAANIIPNTHKSYESLGSVISDARLAGLIDWDMIKDRGRSTIINPHWETPADIVDMAAAQFRIDRWADQPNYVMVMVEKQALEGVLIPTCEKLDVPFAANKGYSSSSAMYETGLRMRHRLGQGKDIHVVYLGDHDPSGMDMTRDVIDRTQLFARGDVEVHRVALNMDQIDELQPPENYAKEKDARFKKYKEEFGETCWELDAIEPVALAQIVADAVEPLINQKLWKASGEREEKFKAELKISADKFRKKQEREAKAKNRKPRRRK